MQEFIKKLNIFDYATFRNTCMKECNVTRATWSLWIRDRVDVPAKYHEIINKVAFDLFDCTVFEKNITSRPRPSRGSGGTAGNF